MNANCTVAVSWFLLSHPGNPRKLVSERCVFSGRNMSSLILTKHFSHRKCNIQMNRINFLGVVCETQCNDIYYLAIHPISSTYPNIYIYPYLWELAPDPAVRTQCTGSMAHILQSYSKLNPTVSCTQFLSVAVSGYARFCKKRVIICWYLAQSWNSTKTRITRELEDLL